MTDELSADHIIDARFLAMPEISGQCKTAKEWAAMLDYDEGPLESSVAEVIEAAVAEEREACAVEAESYAPFKREVATGRDIAASIRARRPKVSTEGKS